MSELSDLFRTEQQRRDSTARRLSNAGWDFAVRRPWLSAFAYGTICQLPVAIIDMIMGTSITGAITSYSCIIVVTCVSRYGLEKLRKVKAQTVARVMTR